MNIFKKLAGKNHKTATADEFTGLDVESLPLAASESAEYYSFLNPYSREMLMDENAAGVIGGTGHPEQQGNICPDPERKDENP